MKIDGQIDAGLTAVEVTIRILRLDHFFYDKSFGYLYSVANFMALIVQ